METYPNSDETQYDNAIDNILIFVICFGIGTLIFVIICFTCYLFWRPLRSWNIESQKCSDDDSVDKSHTSLDTRSPILCKSEYVILCTDDFINSGHLNEHL